MRRAFFLFAPLAIGCFSAGNYCEEGPCPPVSPEPCEGECAPYIGGGWSHVLVAEASGAHCPVDVAPFEAMSSPAPPVTACGLQEEEGSCGARGFVCLPPAPAPWSVCVIRDGAHGCPSPYPEEVDTGAQLDVTICCLTPTGEPK